MGIRFLDVTVSIEKREKKKKICFIQIWKKKKWWIEKFRNNLKFRHRINLLVCFSCSKINLFRALSPACIHSKTPQFSRKCTWIDLVVDITCPWQITLINQTKSVSAGRSFLFFFSLCVLSKTISTFLSILFLLFQISSSMDGVEELLTKFDENPEKNLKESQLSGTLGELVK